MFLEMAVITGIKYVRRRRVITTHDELVHRVETYLLRVVRCGFVFKELSTYTMEIPDAIGWKHGKSHLIECKANRSDFTSDRRKSFRKRPIQGMGNYRYYLCPRGLVDVSELPDKWGLIYFSNSKCRIEKRPEWMESNWQNEIHMMCSALRRVHLRKDLHKIYQPLEVL